MTKNLNIALLSDVPPDSRYTAGQVLRKTLENTDFIAVDFYWLNQSLLHSDEALPGNVSLVRHVNYSYGTLKRKLRIGLEKAFGWIPKARSLIIVGFAVLQPCLLGLKLGLRLRYSHNKALWLVLQGERLAITYWIASRLSGKPYVLQQWDPVSWWLNHRGFPSWLSSRIAALVKDLEKRAQLNLVPSDAWKAALAEQGHSVHRIDNFFLDNEPRRGLATRVMAPNQVNAVFLGQLYSNQELAEILRVLERYCRDRNHDLIVHYFGSSIGDFAIKGVQIVNHGHIDRDSLMNRIAKWDFAILPYPTNPLFDDASRLSFPSKARVYIAAGLPIVSCSNLDSSPHSFLSQNYRASYFNIREPGNLGDFVESCRDSTIEAYEARVVLGADVIKRFFSAQVELQPFHNYLRGLK
jgi:hypothetical protein